MLEEQIDRTKNNKSQTTGWEEKFHRNVLQELWEMVKIIKQEDKAEHRSQLQSYCQKLLKMGQDRPFSPAWNQLLEISERVLSDPKNVYRNSGKLIVKEIKQAADLVLVGNSDLIKISDKLKNIASEPLNIALTDAVESNSLQEINKDEYDRIDIEQDLWSDSEARKESVNPAEEEIAEKMSDRNKDEIEGLEDLLEADDRPVNYRPCHFPRYENRISSSPRYSMAGNPADWQIHSWFCSVY